MKTSSSEVPFGHKFSYEGLEWCLKFKLVSTEDLDYFYFNEQGERMKINQAFTDDLLGRKF